MTIRPWQTVLLGLVLLSVLCTGCGYRTSTRGRTLQGTVAVPFMENRTAYPDIELLLTNNLILALERDGNLSVIGLDAAEYLLTGVLVRFSEAPFNIDPTGKSDEYKLAISADLTFVNKVTGEELWRDKRFTGQASFYLDVGSELGATSFGEQAEVEFTRDWAVVQATNQIIEDVLNVIFGEW
jgi:hypothetical protein